MSRWEEDSIGKMEIPDGVPYGIQTLRVLSLGNFSGSCLGSYPVYVRALLDVKRASARANLTANLISEKQSSLIEAACTHLKEQDLPRYFPVDLLAGGGSIALNRNINEAIHFVITSVLGESSWNVETANLSQSTADVCHSALRVALFQSAQELIPALRTLEETFAAKATEWKDVMTISRTCLRDASVTSLGAFVGGMQAGLHRHHRRLALAATEMLSINLGGTVIGSGEGASQNYRAHVVRHLKEITGLPLRLRENLYDAAQNADDLSQLSSQMTTTIQCWMKQARDFRLLSSGPDAGLNELTLPPVMEGSSFYPGKINPVIPETIIQCGLQVEGNDRTIQSSLDATELNLNVFESVMALNLFSSLQILRNLAPAWESCVKGTVANLAVCRANVERGKYGTAKT